MKTAHIIYRNPLIRLLALASLVTACAPTHQGQSQYVSRYGAPVTLNTTAPTLRPSCDIHVQPCGVTGPIYRVDHMAYVPTTVCCGLPQTLTPPPLPPVIQPPAPQPPVVMIPDPIPEPPVYVEPPAPEPVPPVYIPPPQSWPTPESPVEPWLPTRK